MKTSNPSGHRKSGRSWKKITLRAIVSLVGVVLLLLAAGFIYESITSRHAQATHPPPGKMIDINGYRLHVHTYGTGSPTILLEAGSGETSLSWRQIPEQLAASTGATVVTYDRAGYAWSDTSPLPRTGQNIVKELHTALQKANIPGPYLLAGHSLGGMYSRLFAQTYPDEIAGMVLIDARPENDAERTEAIYKEEHAGSSTPSPYISIFLDEVGAFRLFPNFMLTGRVEPEDRQDFVNVVASPKYFKAVSEEGKLASTTEDAIRNQKLGNLPVRIIARGQEQDLTRFGISEEANNKIEQSWQIGQREMLAISNNSKLIVAKRSEHMIIHDQPKLVIRVIEELLAEIRQKSSDNGKSAAGSGAGSS
ncbi:alpha/beta hydrolase [Paenibacillus bovis]|uniref:Alpha/beta hydrolase n=1 Tax=Paenibacillus bovis TaxID=1616788 RepID=A0A172ZK37_9BACL|nr:alpha/beta hydrolase [Paenibacillus bovis]ANF97986.1 alpha/beta hydrolase [Paenibacillus bovis]